MTDLTLDECAACGASPVVTETTFLCRNEERHICASCWGQGENNEFWDLDISNKIQLRDRAISKKSKGARKK